VHSARIFVVTDRIGFMATNKPTKPPEPLVRPSIPDEGGAVLLERRTLRVTPPPMHQVVLLNDDYTPMEFVVVVIQEYFGKDLEAATRIMLKIHLDGRGVCGIFTKDVAATKVDQVLEAALRAGHPLKCISEPVDF
jgi:ATP-dependent Clp protease adaptor protein ClpS